MNEPRLRQITPRHHTGRASLTLAVAAGLVGCVLGSDGERSGAAHSASADCACDYFPGWCDPEIGQHPVCACDPDCDGQQSGSGPASDLDVGTEEGGTTDSGREECDGYPSETHCVGCDGYDDSGDGCCVYDVDSEPDADARCAAMGHPRLCAGDEIRCADDTGVGFCIPAVWACDGQADCPYEEDESGCGPAHDGPGADEVLDSTCEDYSWDVYCVSCDGYDDSADACCGDDEESEAACGEPSDDLDVACDHGFFACDDGTGSNACIPLEWVCDGTVDCSFGEDEDGC